MYSYKKDFGNANFKRGKIGLFARARRPVGGYLLNGSEHLSWMSPYFLHYKIDRRQEMDFRVVYPWANVTCQYSNITVLCNIPNTLLVIIIHRNSFSTQLLDNSTVEPPTRGQPLIWDTLHGTICILLVLFNLPPKESLSLTL